ncbi:MAG: phenylalanine--tRNA ligase subunit beta [Armatimonadota bacterium]
MRVPLNWLLEYLETDLSPEALADALTMGGLEVEEVDNSGPEPVLVTKVTANRGDLLSLVGVARQAAAVLDTTFTPPRPALEESGDPIAAAIDIQIADPDLCPRYSARLIRGVKVGPSPQWLRQRVIAAGMRPINNVVDATNLVMWELGQPLHAFDCDLLRGAKIIVRRARPGEEITTIDEQPHMLTADDLAIADAEMPVAIAGVMGGADTEVHGGTSNVLLESAHFDATSVRLTAQRHGMQTEASHRFERIVDPAGTVAALDRVAEVIVEAAGGAVAPGVIDVYASPREPRELTLRPERANAILGTDLAPADMAAALRRLGLTVTEGDPFKVTVPTFRPDIEREIGLIEEVAIIHGYDNIPLTLHPGRSLEEGWPPQQRMELLAKEILLQCGLSETLTFSMIGPQEFDRLRLPPDSDLRQTVALANPMSEQHSVMRTTLLASALRTAEVNARRRVQDMALFELGRVYFPAPGQELPQEPRRLVALATGSPMTARWNLPDEAAQVDFFWLKGVLEQLLSAMGVEGVAYSAVPHPTFHPGRCAGVAAGGVELGVIGEVHGAVQRAYELPERAYLFEMDFEAICALARPARRRAERPAFPAAKRDIALVMPDDAEHSAAAVEQTIRDAGGELLREAMVFDVFADEERIGPGHKSVAFSLEFRADDRTLTDDEVDELMARITTAAQDKLGATLRA